MHAGPGQVDRHDIGGNGGGNVRTGIAEVPRTGGQSASGASGGANASVNAGQDNRRSDHGDRGGWSKFGAPSGRSNSGAGEASGQTPSSRSTDQGRVPRIDSAPQSGRGGETPRTQDSGGWQKFPSNSDRGSRPNDSPSNRGNDRVNQGGGKPPLELHRPIVTPRQSDNSNDSRGNNRGNDSRYSPPPQRTPEVHSEPRYTPPPSHNDRSYSPPSHNDRSYSPPSRSESRSSGGSSSHGGGSSHESGGHSDSKSSSNPKHR